MMREETVFFFCLFYDKILKFESDHEVADDVIMSPVA